MKATLDGRPAAAAYSKAFQRFKALEGFDQRGFLLGEAGSILKRWAGLTKVGTEAAADIRSRVRANAAVGTTEPGAGGVTINSGIRGGVSGVVWMNKSRGGRAVDSHRVAGRIVGDTGFVPAAMAAHPYHFKDREWAEIKNKSNAWIERMQRLKPLGRGSVALARQSVVQIADQLGIDLNSVPGEGVSAAGLTKARAAIASNGRAYRNGVGTQGGDDVRCYVQLLNRLPYGSKIGLDRNLATVLTGRAKFIETSYAKGVFDSQKQTARAFPNLVRIGAISGNK